ncbi:MAG: GAF domain-containing sensor histidine kinase [Herpetosiphonaceae bacterium]|nr:GAF domain-containing sensor histidine kinase [Herpetosiphonaceae bacterium]
MVNGAVAPLLITHASEDPRFRDHPGLHIYGIESYIAVPLTRRDGTTIGTLCALDPQPTAIPEATLIEFRLLADLLAFELAAQEEEQQREDALRLLEDFIAIAAHDLRQPLTALYGRAQLLTRRARRGVAASELLASAELVEADARRAIVLSDDLLNLARIETGQMELTSQRFNLVELVERLIDDAETIHRYHAFQVDAPLQVLIDGDEGKLAQVIRNILGNAAKYAPPTAGRIHLKISVATPDAAPPLVMLQIQDCGPGVPTDELQAIFQRRYRTAAAQANQIGGTGWGLHIAEQTIVAHAGRIWAEPTPGGGLTVGFVLPGPAPATA